MWDKEHKKHRWGLRHQIKIKRPSLSPSIASTDWIWGTGNYWAEAATAMFDFSSALCSGCRSLWIGARLAWERCHRLDKTCESSQSDGEGRENWMLIISFTVEPHASHTDTFHHLYYWATLKKMSLCDTFWKKKKHNYSQNMCLLIFICHGANTSMGESQLCDNVTCIFNMFLADVFKSASYCILVNNVLNWFLNLL